MFPGGYNMPFYSPYGNMAMRMGGTALPRSGGIFSKLGALKGINWQGLLNNASRTLGVINQAIPLVKQVGPIYNNMKSMLRVASLFKDETDSKPQSKNINKNTNNNKNFNNSKVNTKESTHDSEEEKTIIKNYSNSPSFFI